MPQARRPGRKGRNKNEKLYLPYLKNERADFSETFVLCQITHDQYQEVLILNLIFVSVVIETVQQTGGDKTVECCITLLFFTKLCTKTGKTGLFYSTYFPVLIEATYQNRNGRCILLCFPVLIGATYQNMDSRTGVFYYAFLF